MDTQETKFENLSTQKKVIHYVGWSLLALGCVGTILFSILWCKDRGGSSPSVIKHIFTDPEDITKNLNMQYYDLDAKYTIDEPIKKNQIYEFTIPNNYFKGHKLSYIDFAIGVSAGGIDGSTTPTNTSDSQLLMGDEKIVFTDPLDHVTISKNATAGAKGNINVIHDTGDHTTPLTLEMGTKDLSVRFSCAIDINEPRDVWFSISCLS